MNVSLCFVTHGYWPQQGGTEVFIQAMAEEACGRGYDVTVFTQDRGGPPSPRTLNGVKILTDPQCLVERVYNMIVVHSTDGPPQCLALNNAAAIKSPILYMIIYPQVWRGMSEVALLNVAYAGCSTEDDWKFIEGAGMREKGRLVRHSVAPSMTLGAGVRGAFRQKYGIRSKLMILSCGGFWVHKGMMELARVFRELGGGGGAGADAGAADVTLVLTGYLNSPENMPVADDAVRVLFLEDKADVCNAMTDADLYVMNSSHEGFGLVLIEAMLNKVPWMARSTAAGAIEMRSWGTVFENGGELKQLLGAFIEKRIGGSGGDAEAIEAAYEYTMNNRLTKHTIDDIMNVVSESTTRP